jgi:protease I
VGDRVPVDVELKSADPADYDVLLLTGGVMNPPDTLRMDPAAVTFVKSFFASAKPVATICHGPRTSIETGYASGKRITSWQPLKTDRRQPCYQPEPDDIPVFNRVIADVFSLALSKAA